MAQNISYIRYLANNGKSTVSDMSITSVLVLNGPNLNLLGQREPEVYGSATLADHVSAVAAEAKKFGISVDHLQTNSEAEMVSAIHDARQNHQGIIINAGAFTHYSWAVHDALRSYDGIAVEVHLSNPGSREDFRHVSVLSSVVAGTISGFGGAGYVLALHALVSSNQ